MVRCSSRRHFAATESPAAAFAARASQLLPHCPAGSTHSSNSAQASSHYGKKMWLNVRPPSRKSKTRAHRLQRSTATAEYLMPRLGRKAAHYKYRNPAPSRHGIVATQIAIAVAARYDFMLARISWYGCTSEVRLRGLARICSTCPHSWRLSRPRMLGSQY